MSKSESTDAGSVRVTLTPTQAAPVAAELRHHLGGRLGDLGFENPDRDDIAEVRQTLDHYERALDAVAWGAPEGAVELVWPRESLTKLADALFELGGQAVATPEDWHLGVPDVRSYALDMLSAAQAISDEIGATR